MGIDIMNKIDDRLWAVTGICSSYIRAGVPKFFIKYAERKSLIYAIKAGRHDETILLHCIALKSNCVPSNNVL